MLTQRQLFLQHQAQTSPFPVSLEIERAEGLFLYDIYGKKYADLISGIAVSNLGHCHPSVINAVKEQCDKYMHLMVYGEYIQSPQVKLAKTLADILPPNLNCSYFVNSGAEAIDGAMKLAKRYTGRTEIISFKNAYHGSTQGALSIMGNEKLKNDFRPLLPDVRILNFNSISDLYKITTRTACVVIETIQGEAGVVLPDQAFLEALQLQCKKSGALLIVDEIQCGAGRTGSMFAFDQYKLLPDILCLAKGIGGGMPIGIFISSNEIMSALSNNPMLGHITTFGGHPVCCAAALATINELNSSNLIELVNKKETLFRTYLKHPKIKEVRGKGLLLAIEFESNPLNLQVILNCMNKGVITDWFLFCDTAMRIAPPLIITEDEIKNCCEMIIEAIEQA